MDGVSCLKSIVLGENKIYREWRASSYETARQQIPTNDLAVGSTLLITNSTLDFYTWNGDDWGHAINA